MTNEMTTFTNAEFGTVRTITIDGDPWFVGKDVATILGYTNPRKALIDHVDDEDKTDGVTIRDSIGREQNPIVINESGLYSLILGSKLPTAKRFKRWVTSEVLPSIRRHGLYAIDDILANPDIAIAALQELKAEREKRRQLENTVAVQTQQIAEMTPKASYYDVVLNCKDLVAISVIAKDYGWSAKRMNKWLHEKGIQFRQPSGIWLLYQQYADKGYTSTKTTTFTGSDGETHTAVHTYWTQAGRLFIYERMKADGNLPLIER
jgi:anti-repressor protein